MAVENFKRLVFVRVMRPGWKSLKPSLFHEIFSPVPLFPGLISGRMKQKAYAAAGVDIDLGNKVKATLPQLLASTHRREVLGKVGGFGGLFALDLKKYREPILVSSVDGVGSRLQRPPTVGGPARVGSAGRPRRPVGVRECRTVRPVPISTRSGASESLVT